MNNSAESLNQPTPSQSNDPVLSIDPSALEFYFEAVLPEVTAITRAGMAAAIRRGVESGYIPKPRLSDKSVQLAEAPAVQAGDWLENIVDTHCAPIKDAKGIVTGNILTESAVAAIQVQLDAAKKDAIYDALSVPEWQAFDGRLLEVKKLRDAIWKIFKKS